MEDWVKRRNDCSPFEMFIRLRKGAEEDVKARNSLLKDGASVRFKVVADNGTFGVSREAVGQPDATTGPAPEKRISDWIDFSWDESGITVKDQKGKTVQAATVTLTDDGECKLKLSDGTVLSCWQFRKRILEDLFFNF